MSEDGVYGWTLVVLSILASIGAALTLGAGPGLFIFGVIGIMLIKMRGF